MSFERHLEQLLELQSRQERGPRREGIFALWLTSRVALDLATLPIDRGQRRRVALLTRRLAPLAVPRPLARGLATALDHLGDGSADGARIALSQLVAPSRESVGADAAEIVAQMAREVHDIQKGFPR